MMPSVPEDGNSAGLIEWVTPAPPPEAAEGEPALLRRLAEGDRGAFWPLWEIYRPLLQRCCLQWLGDAEQAEDALGETLLRAWRGLPQGGQDVPPLRPFLLTVARHVCLNLWRRRGQGLQPAGNWDALEEEALADAAADPQDRLLQEELQLFLVQRIAALSPPLREALVLHSFHDLSVPAIAARLGLSVAAVHKRLQRARAQLHDHLQAYLRGEEGVLEEKEGAHAPLEALLRMKQAELEWQIAPVLQQTVEEIQWRVTRMYLPVVQLPSGMQMAYPALLDQTAWPGNPETALLHQYVRQHPRGWKKRMQLAHRLLAEGRWEEAVSHYRRVVARQPRLPNVHLLLWYALHFLERPEEAVEVCQQASERASRPATQRAFQGFAALTQGRYPAAVQAFRQAIALDPSLRPAYYGLAWLHLYRGQHEEALAVCEEVLQQAPDDLMALLYSLEPLQVEGRWPEIDARLQRALRLERSNPLALLGTVTRRCERRQIEGEEGDETECLLYELLERAPEAPAVHGCRAYFHLCRGEAEQAMALLGRLVEREPQGPQGWYEYARGLWRAGRQPEAADAILRALERYPQVDLRAFEAHRLAAEILTAAGRWRELGEVVERLQQEFSDRWDACLVVGKALAGAPAEGEPAAEWARRATQLQPGLAAAWLGAGEVLACLKRWEEAIDALGQGWQRLGGGRGSHLAVPAALLMGEIFAQQGQERTARAWYERALEQAQRVERVFERALGAGWEGQAREALGDPAGAVRAYRRALALHLLHPQRRQAEEALQRLAPRRGR